VLYNLKVQGTLGITLDNNDVFVVHINECIADNSSAPEETSSNYVSISETLDAPVIKRESNTKRSKYPVRANDRRGGCTNALEVNNHLVSNNDTYLSGIPRNGKMSSPEMLSEPSVAPIKADAVLEHSPRSAHIKYSELGFVKTEAVEDDCVDKDTNFVDCQEDDLEASEIRITDSVSPCVYNSALVVKNCRRVHRNNNHLPNYSVSEYRNSTFSTSSEQTFAGNTSGLADYDAAMTVHEYMLSKNN